MDSKADTMTKFAIHEGDTGSSEVQIALLTQRINELTRHMAGHHSDFSAQRGLLKLIGQRRRLLSYLSKEDLGRYQKLIASLGLRK